MLGRHIAAALRPTLARLPLRTGPVQHSTALGARRSAAIVLRGYATAADDAAAPGSTTRMVKRASTKKAPTKKAATAKKAAPKSSKKPKSATKKPAARTPKVLTEKQKEAKAVRLARAERVKLRQTALRPPPSGATSAWTAFIIENSPKVPKGESPLNYLPQQFKALSPSEREHYNRIAIERTQKGRAEYKRWVESHTPEEIRAANNARRLMRRKNISRIGSLAPIKDERQGPKQVKTPYLFFCVERHASGEFAGIAVTERAKLMGQEWRAMSAGEKSKYEDMRKSALAAAAA